MGIELARAWITVGADSTGLRSDLNAAKQQTEQSIKELALGASAMFASVARTGSNYIKSGLQSAADFEQTTVRMETLIGSAEETKKTLDDLTQFAVETPFEMPQLLSVTQGLIQFGERGKELMETIKILGDASGGTAADFGLLGLVFNQVRGVGKLLTQDFRQLSTRGILSLQDIAKYYGKTTQEAEKMLSSGKVSFADFRAILKGLTEEGGRFNDMMKKQSTTLGGLKSTLNDAFGITLRMLATPLVPYVKKLYEWAIVLANGLASVAIHGGETVSFAVVAATAFSTLGAAIYGAGIALQFFGLSWQKLIYGALRVAPWIAVAAGIGALVGYLVSSKPVVEAFSNVWTKVQAKIETLTAYFTVFFEELKPQFERIAALGAEIMNNLGRAVQDFVEMALGFIGYWIDSSIGTIEALFEFILSSLETVLGYVAFFTQDFSSSFQLISLYGQLAFFTVADIAVGMLNYIYAIFVSTAVAIYTAVETSLFNIGNVLVWLGTMFMTEGLYIVSIFQDISHNIVSSFKIAFAVVGALFSALWKGIVAKVSGKGGFAEVFAAEYEKAVKEAKKNNQFKEVGESGREARDKRREGNTLSLDNVVSRTKEAFETTFQANKGPESAFGNRIGQIDTAITALEKDIKWQQEADRLVAEANKPKKTEAEKVASKAAEAAKSNPFELKVGRYKFSEVGNKIQDSLIKDEKDTGKQQVALLEKGLEKQDELIKGVKEIKPGGLT